MERLSLRFVCKIETHNHILHAPLYIVETISPVVSVLCMYKTDDYFMESPQDASILRRA